MLQFEEEDRINWHELFEAPIFSMEFLKATGNFNVIDLS